MLNTADFSPIRCVTVYFRCKDSVISDFKYSEETFYLFYSEKTFYLLVNNNNKTKARLKLNDMEPHLNNFCRMCLENKCMDMHHIFNEGLNNKIIILSGIDVSFLPFKFELNLFKFFLDPT